MIYLIGQLSVWLLLTAVSMGVAGWMYAAHRAAPARLSQRRERERLVRDLGRLAAGEGSVNDDPDADRARAEAETSLTRIRESRIAELEHSLEQARARANDASAEAAELRRQLDGVDTNTEELARLRTLSASLEQTRAREIEAEVRPVVDDDVVALQAWRLRYFEQRVRYLENNAHAPIATLLDAPAEEEHSPLPEWQAREAQARAAFLEQELRALSAPAAPESASMEEAAPFAADADVDVLLRWRLLYLERRVAHLQAQVAQEPQQLAPVAAPEQEAAPDPDRWKWRARYLESRVRHLEQRPTAVAPIPIAPAAAEEKAPESARAAPPATRRAKPPILAAPRNGAPDDLTLIESISQMQQTTLYALGVFHFEQIAAWTPEHVAWVDQYLRLRGRIDEEEWLEQAADLAREGPAAARRVFEEQD
jgi:predicted flap endonuclease-1-like 5' DNA nuclease